MNYISIDIEADGPIPGDHSMLSLGYAVYNPNLIHSGKINMYPLEGATVDEETHRWWMKQPEEVYLAARVDAIDPQEAMRAFCNLGTVFRPCTVVAYPASFDWMFVYWYIRHFNLPNTFGMSALDIKSYASAVLNKPLHKTIKRNMPREWFIDLPKHTHDAEQDAIEQGELFMRIVKYHERTRF